MGEVEPRGALVVEVGEGPLFEFGCARGVAGGLAGILHCANLWSPPLAEGGMPSRNVGMLKW